MARILPVFAVLKIALFLDFYPQKGENIVRREYETSRMSRRDGKKLCKLAQQTGRLFSAETIFWFLKMSNGLVSH